MARKKIQCHICHQSFKKDHELEQHIDVHTPYWKGKKIVISGADQIRFMLRKWWGSWKAVKASLLKNKHFHDAEKIDQIIKFEKKNKLRFIVCGDSVESFRRLE